MKWWNDLSPKSAVEHETKFSLRIFYTYEIGIYLLMVDAVSWIPIEGNFIFCRTFLKPSMSIVNRNVRFGLKTKTSNRVFLPQFYSYRSANSTLSLSNLPFIYTNFNCSVFAFNSVFRPQSYCSRSGNLVVKVEVHIFHLITKIRVENM